MATATYPPLPPFNRLYKDYSQDPDSAPAPAPTYHRRALYPLWRQLHDFKKELRSLNRELQLYLLEFADVLVERPSQYAMRVEDISLIFQNLHRLLNSLRPHQARATLIHMLELQMQRCKQAVEDIKRRREEAQRLLKVALGSLEGP